MKRHLLVAVLSLLTIAIGTASPFQAKLDQMRLQNMHALAALPDPGATDEETEHTGIVTFKKLGPQKAQISSMSDLVGTWMMSYSDWSGSSYETVYSTVTIKKGLSSNQIVISGWWIGQLAKDITATVNLTSKQFTISRQRLVEVQGYPYADLVNYTDTTKAITGTIGSMLYISGKWGVKIVNQDSYYAVGSGTAFKKCNGKMAYTYDGYDYTDDVLMGQNGSTVAYLSIFNFLGTNVMISDNEYNPNPKKFHMNSDSTFEIEPVLLYTDPEDGANYYCYGTDGTSRWNITGKGTETRLPFATSWSLCSPETDQWMGEISNTYIYYTDGTKFQYPPAEPTGITLNVTDEDELVLEPGQTFQLVATITPANANQAVTWTTSDATVATVDANGLVTALEQTSPAPARAPRLEGGGKTVTITATSVANTSLKASVKLYVGVPIVGKLGDLNGDGLVNLADINILVDFVLGLTTADLPGADLNNDGLVNLADVNILVDIVLGLYNP